MDSYIDLLRELEDKNLRFSLIRIRYVQEQYRWYCHIGQDQGNGASGHSATEAIDNAYSQYKASQRSPHEAAQ